MNCNWGETNLLRGGEGQKIRWGWGESATGRMRPETGAGRMRPGPVTQEIN